MRLVPLRIARKPVLMRIARKIQLQGLHRKPILESKKSPENLSINFTIGDPNRRVIGMHCEECLEKIFGTEDMYSIPVQCTHIE